MLILPRPACYGLFVGPLSGNISHCVEPWVIKPKFRVGHCCGATLLMWAVRVEMSVFIREKKVRSLNRGDLFYRVDEV